MAGKQVLEFSTLLEAQGVAAYLESLARGLRDGRLLIESGDRSLSLDIPAQVRLDFEARSNPGKTSVEISLDWRLPGADDSRVEAPPSLLIASAGEAEQDPEHSADSDIVLAPG